MGSNTVEVEIEEEILGGRGGGQFANAKIVITTATIISSFKKIFIVQFIVGRQ